MSWLPTLPPPTWGHTHDTPSPAPSSECGAATPFTLVPTDDTTGSLPRPPAVWRGRGRGGGGGVLEKGFLFVHTRIDLLQ